VRKFFGVLLFLLVIVGIGAGLFASIVWGRLHEPYKGFSGEEQFVEIPPGTAMSAIGQRLVDAGVVRDYFIFRIAVWRSGRGQQLKAGDYRFTEPISAADAVDRLARGDVYTQRVTFPEGLTILEMAKLYEAKGLGPAADFSSAAGDESLVADLDPAAPDLEGYLFPETYSLPRDAPAARLVGQMVSRFKSVYTEALRQEAAAQGFTTREVVTLASLVEKETGKDAERPMIAAVYRNRLKIGMPMQADPTLIYALQKAGKYDGNIRKTDMTAKSPYNTYANPGLPPGPIASPGTDALRAVLNPADVPYLYFVSRNDGTHVFAATLAEHNANVKKFQVDYFRARRSEGK
jgi:UPF0755 protein